MSSPMRLHELDTREKEDQLLLEHFEDCRHSVIRVSSSPTVHDCIAVTTKGGFVELINVTTGAFRVFLSHLGSMPLDSALRCFSLVPALYPARGRHHLLYSLAYSNELLISDMERGTVEVLAAFHSRPSVVFCDGDHMGCGEGCGQVTLWRAPSAADGAKFLWRRSVFADTVLCITVQRDYVICSSADYHCYVLSIASGDVLAALPQESAPAVALQSVLGLHHRSSLMALCLPNVLFIYSTASKECATRVAIDSPWSCAAVLRLDVSISCASCCAGFMVCGTASGVVLLLSIDEKNNGFVERVRFDVGFSVVGIQLFTNGTLVVITSVGDVWKWAIDDLLPAEEEEEGEKDERNGIPLPNAQSPRAMPLPPSVSAARGSPGDGEEQERGNENKYDDDDDDEIVVVIDEDMMPPSCCCSSSSRHSVQVVEPETSSASSIGTSGASRHDVDCAGAAREITEPPGSDVVTSVGPNCRDASTFPALGGTAHCDVVSDDVCSEPSFPPSSISIVGCTTGAADTVRSVYLAPSHPAPDAPPPGSPPLPVSHTPRLFCPTKVTTGCDTISLQQGDVPLTVKDAAVKHNPVSPVSPPRALQRVLRGVDMGPPAVINGLCAGTRMDPRKARHIVENTCSPAFPPPVLESQSSTMLVDHRQMLEMATCDHSAYAKAHPLKVEALKHRHAVKLPVYGMQTQMFVAATEVMAKAADSRLQDPPNAVIGKSGCGNTCWEGRQQQPPSSAVDDLMDITFRKFARRKDPALEEERRRGGPDIWKHLCGSLMCNVPGPSGTVLFHELRVPPGVPDTLLLPMPLPPTPSVF